MGNSFSNRVFGQIYTDSAQVVNLAVAATYYQITGMTADININTSIASSRITVLKAGYYLVQCTSSFTHVTNNTVIHHSLFVDGVEDTRLEFERKIGAGGDVGNAGGSVIIFLDANQVLDIRAKSVSNTGNLTTNHFNFNVMLVGEV